MPKPLYVFKALTLHRRTELRSPFVGLSRNRPYLWRFGQWRKMACEDHGHATPHALCTCGLYGLYRPLWAAREIAFSRMEENSLVAMMECAGQIQVSSHGVRAQKMRLVALVIETPLQLYRPILLKRLQGRGVKNLKVLTRKEAMALAQAGLDEYGITPPKAIDEPMVEFLVNAIDFMAGGVQNLLIWAANALQDIAMYLRKLNR